MSYGCERRLDRTLHSFVHILYTFFQAVSTRFGFCALCGSDGLALSRKCLIHRSWCFRLLFSLVRAEALDFSLTGNVGTSKIKAPRKRRKLSGGTPQGGQVGTKL